MKRAAAYVIYSSIDCNHQRSWPTIRRTTTTRRVRPVTLHINHIARHMRPASAAVGATSDAEALRKLKGKAPKAEEPEDEEEEDEDFDTVRCSMPCHCQSCAWQEEDDDDDDDGDDDQEEEEEAGGSAPPSKKAKLDEAGPSSSKPKKRSADDDDDVR